MKKIFKYELTEQTEGIVKVELPTNAKILKVAFQNGRLCLWAIVDDGNKLTEKRTIMIYGTGEPIEENTETLKHLDTIFQDIYVWHIFEQVVS